MEVAYSIKLQLKRIKLMGNCMGDPLRNNKAASKFPHFRRESYLSAARG